MIAWIVTFDGAVVRQIRKQPIVRIVIVDGIMSSLGNLDRKKCYHLIGNIELWKNFIFTCVAVCREKTDTG